MPQRIRDLAVAALALGAALVALTSLDGRVPSELSHAISEGAGGGWIAPGSPFGDAYASLSANPALDNLFVVAFVTVAMVLVILMVRT